MLKLIWRRIIFVCAAVAAVLGFFAFIELVRAYQVLDELHPWLGIGYLCALSLILLVLVAYYMRSVMTRRKILKPPDRADRRRYAEYLMQLAKRLDGNERVSSDLRQALRYRAIELEQALKSEPDDEIGSVAESFLADSVGPCIKELNGAADREVQRCVRDVMIGVTISPWRAADLLIVSYRNVLMVIKVIGIYDVRPTAGSQVRTMLDISKIVFTVNILNYGSKLAENLASGIPFVGRFVDDIAQGVGAGLLTSMAGHAAIERCSCLQPWDRALAQVKMGAKAKDFAADLKGIVADDILPRLKLRIPQKDAEAESGRMENLKAGVARAMDQTSEVMDVFLRKPAVAAGRGVAATGRGVSRGGAFVLHGVAAGFKGVGRGFMKVVRRGKRRT